MSPRSTVTFYRWGTGPQEIKLLCQGHREWHSQGENTSALPKLIYVPSCWLKKTIFTENYLKKKNSIEKCQIYGFFPQQNTPNPWTTGASEVIIFSQSAFNSPPLYPALPRCPCSPDPLVKPVLGWVRGYRAYSQSRPSARGPSSLSC